MHERKDKYKYFDMKLDSAKDAFFKKKAVLVYTKFYITKKSNNNSPNCALILS